MTKKEICHLVVRSVKDYLSSPSRLDGFKAKNRFVRKRVLTIAHVIMYLLFSGKSSMAVNLSNIKRELCPVTSFPKKVTRQAISSARQGIHPDLFRELFDISVDSFYKNIPERRTWNGLHVFAIDGSKFELPNSQKNFDFFGEMFSCHDPDKKYTQALASSVYDVLDDYIVHASMTRFLASERDAARTHMETLRALGIFENSVVIFDRGYYSEEMFRYCVSNNHPCVMRLKEGYSLSKAAGKKNADIETVLPGDGKKGTEDIPVRVIAVKLDSGEYEYLATNIFDRKYTPEMFRELYFLRWPIEIKYLELKERFQIEEFNGATPVSVMQEFYITLLFSNLCSLIKSDADDEIERTARPTNKYRYQSNRAFIISQMKLLVPKMVFGTEALSVLDDIYQDACIVKSQIQPGRKYKRKTKKDNRRTHYRNRKRCV